MTKVALITGGARRIGTVVAHYLHNRGMNVIIHYYDSKHEAEKLAAELNETRTNSARILKANLNKLSDCEKLIAEAFQTWQRLDVLINNASRFYPTVLENCNEMQWNDLLDSNVKAPFFLAKASAPYLEKNHGCIINVADIHGIKPLKNYSIYCISKAALIMLTKTLAKELGPNIRVNTIAPGAVLWPEEENELSEEVQDRIIAKTILKRAGNGEDVAKAVWFFITDAPYVTGQMLAVDGGRSVG